MHNESIHRYKSLSLRVTMIASRNSLLRLSIGIVLVRLSSVLVVVDAIVSRFPQRWLNAAYFPLAPLEMNNRTLSESDVPTYKTLVGKSVSVSLCGGV